MHTLIKSLSANVCKSPYKRYRIDGLVNINSLDCVRSIPVEITMSFKMPDDREQYNDMMNAQTLVGGIQKVIEELHEWKDEGSSIIPVDNVCIKLNKLLMEAGFSNG